MTAKVIWRWILWHLGLYRPIPVALTPEIIARIALQNLESELMRNNLFLARNRWAYDEVMRSQSYQFPDHNAYVIVK